MPAAKKADTENAGVIEIKRLGTENLLVPIRGTAPLLVHKFSEKAKKQMLDAMQGIKSPKQNKDPEAEFKAAFYYTDDGQYGFPVIGFKAATVSAARFYANLTMTGLRQQLFMSGPTGPEGQMLAVIDGEPEMREDVVRVGQGGTDLRYRPMFREWKTLLRVRYVTSLITRDTIVNLIEAGGMGVGVGEWRPERKGDYGTFEIDTEREIEVVA